MAEDIQFHILQPDDEDIMQLISDWYIGEWNIPKEKTIEKLKAVVNSVSQFQVIMLLNNVPVATAGVYHHVGLLDKEPRFNIYKNWLALVYTIPAMRQKGYGALLCQHIDGHSKKLGIQEMYLFTDTAERLYTRLGWQVMERLPLGERNVVVMKKDL